MKNRKRTFVSNVMQPPHLTVSVNAQRESEKDHIMRMAQRANHLTENLVKSPHSGNRTHKQRNSESIAITSGS